MDFTTLTSVVGITVICYLIGLGAKTCEKIPDKCIPVVIGICGGILGAVGMMTMPDYPATDIITAIAVGIVSGLGSTGVNQIWKQKDK